MRTLRPMLVCLAVLLLTSCVQPLPPKMERCIELKVEIDDVLLTKDPEMVPGENKYNENYLSWVDFYLYEGEYNESEPPISHVREISGQKESDDFKLIVSLSTGVTKLTVFAVANFPVDGEGLVDGKTIADLKEVVAVADFDKAGKHKQDHFLMWGSKTFGVDGEKNPVGSGTIRLYRYASKMTMTVHVAKTVRMDNEEWVPMLDGMEVYLVDAVKKVKLGGIYEEADDSKYFEGNLEGNPDFNRKRFVTKDRNTGEYVPTPGEYTNNEIAYYEVSPQHPIYMYPQQWDYTGGKEPYLKLIIPWFRKEYRNGDIYIAPTQKQCYYKVRMPKSLGNEFESNNWYHLGLDVEILGALIDENPVDLEGTCYIMYWQDKEMVIKHALVGRARFLSVDRHDWELQNLNEIDIPYLSSHPVMIEENSISVTRPYYGSVAVGNPALNGTVRQNEDGSKYLEYNIDQRKAIRNETDGEGNLKDWIEVNETTSSVEFRHILNNQFKSTLFDYSPYTISFTLKHQDDDKYQETITLTQYPAIYIDKIRNSDLTTNVTDELHKYDRHSDYWGYTFVDGGAYEWDESQNCFVFHTDQTLRQSRKIKDTSKEPFFKLQNDAERREYQWRTVWYSGGSVDIFRFSISVLPTDVKLTVVENGVQKEEVFVIGDPRVTVQDNLDFTYRYPRDNQGNQLANVLIKEDKDGFAWAPAMYGDSYRTLKWYYPTDETDRTRNMLAPSFRISTKYGGVEYGSGEWKEITLEYAKYRCAAYQEDGFPAGRWRLPTLAEVSFVAQLSVNQTFSPIFNNSGNYWSANGAVRIENGSVEPKQLNNALLRCVYDTWYWGDDQKEYDQWRRLVYPPSSPAELRNMFVWGDRPR